MDELGEFPASVLETLRQPLEEGVIRISRARALLTLPARFLLVGAMNPCPCGQPAGPGSCRCSDRARYRYAGRLSGPLLDRFDLRVDVGRPELHDLLGGPPGECTAVVRARVAAARALALDRAGCTNAELPAPALDVVAPLTPAALVLLEHQLRAGRLSARGLHRVRRVARTLADLDGGPAVVGEDHLCLAFELRREAAFEAVPA